MCRCTDVQMYRFGGAVSILGEALSLISSSSSSIVLIRDLVWFVLGFLILDGPWLNEKSWIFRFFFFSFLF